MSLILIWIQKFLDSVMAIFRALIVILSQSISLALKDMLRQNTLLPLVTIAVFANNFVQPEML